MSPFVLLQPDNCNSTKEFNLKRKAAGWHENPETPHRWELHGSEASDLIYLSRLVRIKAINKTESVRESQSEYKASVSWGFWEWTQDMQPFLTGL